MAQDGVRQTKIALGVFKVDWIHLVRHGRRTDLAILEFLLEEAQRDVAPDIPVQVDEDQVSTRKGIEQLRQRVVWLDLNRVRVEFQPQ
ncbi:MAG: hypothetical protein CAPSK01_001896 [Candidatus Accumulibacter vicinus]|uniref:Uncharacterized protein n=1 Tax=Candidatus Accumulibacter vicinus TaxID=2954382 RepID=A0A084Y1A6_9PROT|nr:MAG: hypothetical protein CAPSK01_001896 [Candidatus Accumulibacter vicinus]